MRFRLKLSVSVALLSIAAAAQDHVQPTRLGRAGYGGPLEPGAKSIGAQAIAEVSRKLNEQR